MKTFFKWILLGAVILPIFMVLNSCTKSTGTLEKSVTLTMSMTTQPGSTLKGTNALNEVGDINITSAIITIADLTIEENSGENNQSEGDNENENDDDGNLDDDSDTELDDIFLPGPFVLEVVDGNAFIGEVDVMPGTFKQVNFKFNVVNDLGLGDYSILITGEYTDPSNTTIPFTLISNFDKEIQLPLAGGGVTVEANSRVELAVVLEINAWINSLDFASATIVNNSITIDSLNNLGLLLAFEAFLEEEIDIDED